MDREKRIKKASEEAMEEIRPLFTRLSRISEENTARVLAAFRNHRVSDTMFSGTTGYGYDDHGRETLERVYASVMGGEAALVRTGFVNGTHAIGCALFSALRSGDVLLSVTGAPYDTLRRLIGGEAREVGSLSGYGIGYKEVPLTSDGKPDIAAAAAAAADKAVKMIFIQRSKGYLIRESLSCLEIGRLIQAVKAVNPEAAVVVDNCYGEFVETEEPCHIGADLAAGSLIKNPGGGIAPAGGYVVGRRDLVEGAAARLTIPGIGGECGATLGVNRLLFQGLFLAPHVTMEALKTAIFGAALLRRLGFSVSPLPEEPRHDIIQTVAFGAPEPLLAFCRGIQAGSPVDSFVTPEPWKMPGYDCPVVMAAGAFVQGASIELSCDAPMRPPYTAYLQGGITFESGKLCMLEGARQALEAMEKQER